MTKQILKSADPELYQILRDEIDRQQNKLSMIPSENFSSVAVREAVGSVFMNKYSEGYPHKRYYEGNENIDKLELLAIERATKLFNLPSDWAVNVQTLSGSAANLAVYLGLLEPGDTIMGMYLPDGGHLSHGWSYEPKSKQDHNILKYVGGSRKVNITSRFFNSIQYKTDPKTRLFDYDAVEKIALEVKPKLIITGGTAYPREIDYKRMREIADKVGAYYLADIAHEAGLVAAGVNKSPVGIADVVTFTTHKTLRATRGAIILAKKELMAKIDRAVFPGLQGGPHNHTIAGIAVGLYEAMQPEFKKYAKQIVINAQALSAELIKEGFNIVSGGTDKHLLLIDLSEKSYKGKELARALDYAGIVTNMNTMPQETNPPANPSALRLGTPWITTRGLKEKDMQKIANWISRVGSIISTYESSDFEDFDKQAKDDAKIKTVAVEVKELCQRYPLAV
ncbi:MAG: serine hydroxymethyltransferase [Candidatus Dojkabacteria bacterium]|uniref:Serine hydroxymethyltransferase n=2 Tax=Candidatus Dojkabacteria TaxID=74243 RepID=A0A136KK48_9BACT|nr:MAG: Serine hydroxymethyltransferase [candidate division WS6 bacterium OLB21]MBW7954057.1 serine hydroxymethyltransferase [Candidatus Dojkabacteria bacterium]WKZ27797.1 MAG: serine hydroxymethyltransferase [Candidatus Dojkabacteria bacterium]